MPGNQRDDTGILRFLINRETRYLRNYIGIVLRNDDELRKGRVLVGIPELLWTSEDTAVWCFPRQVHALTVPARNEQVEVHFVAGDPGRAVYDGIASELQNQTPSAYDGEPTTHVLYEDPDTAMRLVFNASSSELLIENDKGSLVANVEKDLTITVNGASAETVGGNKTVDVSGDLDINASGKVTVDAGAGQNIELNGSADSLTLFNALVTAINTWVAASLNTHVHPTAAPGPPSPPTPPIGNPSLTTAEATRVKAS